MTYEQHKAERDAARQVLRVLGLTDEVLASIDRGEPGVRAGSLPVRAPLEGTIIEKHAVVGELVEPGSDVMLLADLTTVWVWADIYEQDLPRLIQARNQGPIPVNVLVRAFPGQPFEGKIDYVGATMEERTRTVKVRATVENTDRLLRPGMFCEIRMGVGAREEVLAIPKGALLSDEGRDFVFRHWKEDYYVRRPVQKGRDILGPCGDHRRPGTRGQDRGGRALSCSSPTYCARRWARAVRTRSLGHRTDPLGDEIMLDKVDPLCVEPAPARHRRRCRSDGRRRVRLENAADRCLPRRHQRSGHDPDRGAGTGAGGRGAADHLSARAGHAGVAGRAAGTLPVKGRPVAGGDRLRGPRGHLFRPAARVRTSAVRQRGPARVGGAGDGADQHGPGRDLPVHAREPGRTRPWSCARFRTG